MKKIREIIGKREAFFVRPDITVREVTAYLCEKGVGAVAICEGADVVGVFSERDLMRRVVNEGLDPDATKVSEVMTKEVVHVMSEERYSVAKAVMMDRNFRHLVVLDEDGRLKGFVSIRELIELDLEESQDLVRKLNDNYYQQDFKRPD